MSTAQTKEDRALKKQMITEHLLAMRRMIVIIVAALFVCFILIFYFFIGPLVHFVLQPVYARGIDVIATRVSESLMMKFKTALVAAAVVSMPVTIWQIWEFVSPALYKKERKVFLGVFLAMIGLFFVGVAFSYVVVFPLAVDLFYEASAGVATPMWSVEEYFNFTLSFVLPFGLMFELPAVIYMLARHGKVTGKGMGEKRKFFILGAAVAAAILTPPDVVSQILLLLPMLALYEISALIARTVKPLPPKEEAEEEEAEEDAPAEAEEAKAEAKQEAEEVPQEDSEFLKAFPHLKKKPKDKE